VPRRRTTAEDGRYGPLAGFSAIELIGVLAVVTILVAVLAPAVIRQMDQAARTRESADLSSISNAIVLQAISANGTKMIPCETNWATAVAGWSQVAVNQVTTNVRRNARAVLVDQTGWFSAGKYEQAAAGSSSLPANARMLILGSIGPALPIGTGKVSSAAFENLWNTPDGTKPSGWTWSGTGDDLVIQRMNFAPLFHRLVLVNCDTLNSPTYSIDAATAVVPPVGQRLDGYFLDASVVGLCDTNGVPWRKVVLTRDESFVFAGNTWRDYLVYEGSNEMLANEFADLAKQFMDIDWASTAHQGADQQGVIVSMFNFMLTYTLWANQCPDHFPAHGITGQGTSVPEYQFLQQIGGSGSGANAFGRLGEFTGENGLLD
jgi:type II secretory pathway pseudopilin PulG